MFSHSKIGTFEQCPKKYEFRYIQRLKSETESIEGYLGKRVHEALDRLYDLARNGRLLTEEELLASYDAEWDRNWTANVVIVKKDLTPENYRAVGRKCLRDYYRRYHPFDGNIVVDTEKRMIIDLDAESRFQLVGIIDRIDKVADGVFQIHDYKTNATLPTQQEKDSDRQLALYEIGLRKLFPNLKEVQLVWHYLRFDEEIRSKRTSEELEQLRPEMIQKIQEIETAREFPPVESRLCDWCEYRPVCPLWQHLFKTEDLPPKKFQAEDGVSLVNRLAKIAAQRREIGDQDEALKVEREQLENAIVQYAKKHGVQRLFGSDREATVSQKKTWLIPTKTDKPREYDALVEMLKATPFWARLTAFSRHNLETLLNTPEEVELRKKLEAIVRQEEEWQVFLRKRKDLEAT